MASRFDFSKLRFSPAHLSEWSGSLVVHLLLVGVLGLFYVETHDPPKLATVVSDLTETTRIENFQEEMFKETQINLDAPIAMTTTASGVGGAGGGGGGGGGIGAGIGGAGLANPVQAAGQAAAARAAIGNRNLVRPMSGKLGGLKLDTTIAGIKGANEFATGGDQGAIQRISQEVLRQLSKNKVVVAWIFDSSLSLEPRRKAIAAMFDRIYDEFEGLGINQGGELLTAIVSVGQRTEFHIDRPTNDVEAIRAAIAGIEEDDTGIENLFRAIRDTASKFRRVQLGGQRTLMIVLITDEVGDDRELAEETVKLLKRNHVPLYVMGPVASFGQEVLHERWEDPETKFPFWIPILRGPYTRKEEIVRVPFCGAHYPSGFGPFALTQLSRETGGIYFIFPDDKVKMEAYDTDSLNRYKANYGSEEDYAREIASSPLRQGLMAIVEEGNKIWHPNMPPWWLHDQNLLAEIEAHQKDAALFTELAGKAIGRLETLEKEFDKETNPRWRANYDLISARVLQAAARCAEYNWAYADFKINPRVLEDPKKNNGWHVQFVDAIRSGTRPGETKKDSAKMEPEKSKKTESKLAETVKGWVERSLFHYDRLVSEHPGTPWAQAAAAEKSHLVGVELVEGFDIDYIKNEDREKASKVKVPKR